MLHRIGVSPLLTFLLIGCAVPNSPLELDKYRLTQGPREIPIRVNIVNFKVEDYHVDRTDLGRIDRLAVRRHTYWDGKRVWIRFDPEPATLHPYHYMASIEPMPRKYVTIVAFRVDLPRSLATFPPPPQFIHLTIEVQDGAVKSHMIVNPSEATVGLYVASVESRQGQKVALLRSHVYPSARWRLVLPQGEGVNTATALLEE